MTERIEVFYNQVPTGVEWLTGPAYHKYLVYTDKSGKRYSLRAGPDHGASNSNAAGRPSDPNQDSPYGPVRFEDAPFEENQSTEFGTHARSLGEPYLVGDDLSGSWRRMRSAFHGIEPMNYQYWPQGVNSNTIIDATLARSGHKPTYRDGAAGNREWTGPDRQGLETIWTPGLDRLPSPPGAEREQRRGQGSGRGRRAGIRPIDLLELSDDDFARETDGRRWRQIWER